MTDFTTDYLIVGAGAVGLAFADTLMIGHHATSELAAAAFVNNIINLVIIFALGFSYAVTPTVGTLYGQEKTQRIGEMVRNAICANLLLAALIVGVMGGFYLSIDHLGQPTELLPLIKPYYLVLLASLPFVCLFNVFKQFADGITDTALSMWVLIGGIFFGGVHDYGALFASVRNNGQSIGTVVETSISKKAKRLFLIFSYLTLILVVAAFASIVANTFKATYVDGVVDVAASAANATTAIISLLFIIDIETGALMAMHFADEALLVTNPEVSSVRDSDRILGMLGSKTKRAIEGGEPIKEHLLITRYNPSRVEDGQMLSLEDIQDILRIKLIGVIPESEVVLQSSNQGTPAIHAQGSDVSEAYKDVIDRFLGQEKPLRFIEAEKPGFFKRLFGSK